MPTVTLFKNATTTTGPSYIDSAKLVEFIRNGRWGDLVDQLNALPFDSPEQKKFKSSSLPGIVWQGKFTERKITGITEHSGLVALDFDKLPPEAWEHYRAKLTADPFTHILFTSPRMNGLKCIIRIPPSIKDHKLYMGAIKEYYKSEYYDHFDDVSRLCFVSYDPEIYFNPESTVWEEKLLPPKKKSKPSPNNDYTTTFNKLCVWADKNQGYTDGNKHRHLVALFSACNRFGIPMEDTLTMSYNHYSGLASEVSFEDYRKRIANIYQLYGADFDTQQFDESVPMVPVQVSASPLVAQSENTDPVSFFNANKSTNAKRILEEKGWRKIASDDAAEYWLQPGMGDDSEPSATWIDGTFYVTHDAEHFKSGHKYTPFQILTRLTFKGNHRAATEWILSKYYHDDTPYLRIGTDYFKKIIKIDRFGIEQLEIKRWTKEEIKEDHGKKILSQIPHFDDFTIEPNNLNYQPAVNNCYNLYRQFPHKPCEGTWKWTEILLQHIFGEQYDMGIRYMQILYLHPDRIMPILVLVSRERQTGKTTFINWLNMIFSANMSNIGPEELINGFNSPFAAANIIAVEETLVEKQVTVEKIKKLATNKFITVNQKFISQYQLPFFGKIILTSNNEDKFARIDQEEIRFFIRKLGYPTTKNHNIESDMVAEIPAFLHYLTTLPPVDFSHDRSGFTPQELNNEYLGKVKKESRSELCKELSIRFEEIFLNDLCDQDDFEIDASSIKDLWFQNNKDIGRDYIRRVLKNEMGIIPTSEPFYIYPIRKMDKGKTARAFTIKREQFTSAPKEDKGNIPPF